MGDASRRANTAAPPSATVLQHEARIISSLDDETLKPARRHLFRARRAVMSPLRGLMALGSPKFV